MVNSIYVADSSEENNFLRKKTEAFDFSKHTKKEIAELLKKMKKIMRAANGIGLAANQIGLPYRMFVAEVESSDGTTKFYAVFNPKFEKTDSEKKLLEEGCLSVPGAYGDVNRSTKVVLTAQDRNGKPIRIKAWGLLSHVFQHEMDHLEGTLFIDKSKNVSREARSERLVEHEKARK